MPNIKSRTSDYPGLDARILLGEHFLTRTTDNRYNNLPFFRIEFREGYAFAGHDFPDYGDLTSRYLEALYIVRRVGISDEGITLLRSLQRRLISWFDPEDGLNYRPSLPHGISCVSRITGKPYVHGIAEGFDQSRVMMALIAWYEGTGEDIPGRLLDNMVTGLKSKAVIAGDMIYFSRPYFSPGYMPSPAEAPYPQQLYFAGVHIMPLVRWYELTGNRTALDMAAGITNFILRDDFYFGEDGSFRSLEAEAPGSWEQVNGHTHSRLGTIAGIIKYGRIVYDSDRLECGRRAFDWFVENYCLETGWCPEFLGRHPLEEEGCETCTLKDLMLCCLELCAAGYDQYWDLVDRLVKNQLVQQQITCVVPVKEPVKADRGRFEEYPVSGDCLLGGFAGWSGVNDLKLSRGLMNCCGPAGIKALCLARENACRREGYTLYINLLIDSESPSARVKCRESEQGLVQIDIRESCRLDVRMPDWVDSNAVHLQVNGDDRAYIWNGCRLSPGGVLPGDRIEISYPLRLAIITEKVGKKEYAFRWRGNTAVEVDPTGRELPLYQG